MANWFFDRNLPEAEGGNRDSQTAVARMYARGHRGAPQDQAEAVKWFRLAIDQGHAIAMPSLGAMYVQGRGAPLDYVHAHRWLTLADAAGAAVGAANYRDSVVRMMTRWHMAEARLLARDCLASDYKNCGEWLSAAPTDPNRS